MGGGKASPPGSVAGDEDSSLDQDSSQLSFPLLRSELSMEDEDGAVDKDSRSGSVFRDYSRLRDWEAKERMRETVYRKIMQSGELSSVQGKHLKEAKDKILSYTPGAWIEATGGMKRRDYDVPKTTTLLLVGPKGSGKSSLINRISKMLEDDKFASERAQVSYNLSVGDGTLFLREYMMPRDSTSFCIYDTRSLSSDLAENIGMLRHWMVDGVRHGELAIRDSDSQSWRTAMIHEAHEKDHLSSAVRKVNFVIFVVNGLSVLKSLESDEDAEIQYSHQGIASVFNCRFLAFKDDKPAVVITHGDLLSHDERARVRVHLGELLGIPPTTQIFDIPESSDPVTDSTTIDMLRYSLEHAEKNFTQKKKVFTISLLPCMLLLMLLGTVINLWCMYHHAHIQQFPSTQSGIEHCQCPQAHFQHCHYPHAYLQHDQGPFSGEHNQKEHLREEHIEQDNLPEEHIQEDLFPQEQVRQYTFPLEQVQQDVYPQGQVRQDSLPLEQVEQDTLPQEQVQQVSLPQDHVQQDLLLQHHDQHDPLPQMHIVQHDCSPSSEMLTQHGPSTSLTSSTSLPLTAHSPPSVPSGHKDGGSLPQESIQDGGSMPQESIQDASVPSSPQEPGHHDTPPSIPLQTPLHYGPLPRVQAELEKIKTKAEKFRTKLDWSKIRHLYLDEDSKIHVDWKKIRGLYLDEDSKMRIDWNKIRGLYLDD
ncbi:uncharacterized protein LOC126782739 isoform X2 [Argentina anserina]|uniref:uncharacterized protein LOC126782739 isoform X2 n=1 Tax=Argentina anserina TaxID=57926 RepID=UPI0021768DCD|nr:uncharacterized protein LOC126782739 isoform X2 [Potentilla anserina]